MTSPNMTTQQTKHSNNPQALDCAELQALCADDSSVKLLDVRTGGEFETLHIPGSVNIPLDRLGEHLAPMAGIGHPMVLICQSGARAEQAHSQLSQSGKGRLFVLDGGVAAWQAAGNDVFRGQTSRWAMDRQVRFVAGLMIVVAVVASMAIPQAKWLAAAVAAGLVYSAATNTCAMAGILGRLPYNRSTVDVDAALARLS